MRNSDVAGQFGGVRRDSPASPSQTASRTNERFLRRIRRIGDRQVGKVWASPPFKEKDVFVTFFFDSLPIDIPT